VLSISSSAFAAVDFMNDDAPFKTDFNLAGHNGDMQLYGIIDIGYGYTDHGLPTNNALPNNFYPFAKQKIAYSSSQSDWFSGGLQQSRVGLKGGVNLFEVADTKIKFIYQLETGFNALNGELINAAKTLAQNGGGTAQNNSTISADSSVNGQFFNRQAYAGFDMGKAGKATFGLQYNPFYTITGDFDPLHKADTFSPIGQSGTYGGGGGVSENSRMANSFKYANELEALGGKFNGGVMYQVGNATGDWNSPGYGWTTQLGYSNKSLWDFGIQVAYDRFADSLAAGTSTQNGNIALSLYNTDAFVMALQAKPVEDLKLSGGWEWFTRKGASNWQEMKTNYTTVWGYSLLKADGSIGVSDGSAGKQQEQDFFWAGFSWDVGHRIPMLKDLEFDLAYYDTLTHKSERNDGFINDGSQGRIGTYSALLDYKINKRFDVYGAFTQNHFTGPAYGGVYNTDQYLVGTGVRMKF